MLKDPYVPWHPVRVIGLFIETLKNALLEKGFCSEVWGGVLYVVVVGTTVSAAKAVEKLGFPFDVALAYFFLSTGSLFDEVLKVASLLSAGDIEKARDRLSGLVTRDTSGMDGKTLVSTALETLSENFVDAVISPTLYLFAFGLPGLALYRATSTLDSMVGYRKGPLESLGKVSAIMDDVLNYIPARLSCLIIGLSGHIMGYPTWRLLKRIKGERGKTESPNSWIPEASTALVLGLRIGGPCVYFGETKEKPYIGVEARNINTGVLLEALSLLYFGVLAFLLTLCLIELFLH